MLLACEAVIFSNASSLPCYLDKVTRLAELLIASRSKTLNLPSLSSRRAISGLATGQEVARQLNCRFVFGKRRQVGNEKEF